MAIHKHIKENISIPVIGAPLFLVSGPDLVIAQCKAGIIGAFPALNARPQNVLDEWLTRIKTELAEYKEANPDAKVAPFAVNQICHGSNDRLMADMETCVKHEVPIIITSLRPPSEVVEAAHSYGGLVYHDVISVRHAQKAAENDIDGIFGELLPQLSLNGSLAKSYDPSPGLYNDERSGVIGITATIPLYKAGNVRSRVRQAKHTANQRYLSILEIKRAITEEAVTAWENLHAATASEDARNANALLVLQKGLG